MTWCARFSTLTGEMRPGHLPLEALMSESQSTAKKPLSGFAIVMVSFVATLVIGLGLGSILFFMLRSKSPGVISPIPTQSLIQIGKIDDANPAITYFGSWVEINGLTGANGNAYNGTLRQSTIQGQTMMMDFEGQGIVLVYQTLPTGGIMDVTIDGVIVASINQYSSEPVWQVEWKSDTLKPGQHTLVLTHTSGQSVNIDAIIIQGEPTVTPSLTVTETSTSTASPAASVSGTPPAPLFSATFTVTGTPPTATSSHTITKTKTPTTYKTATRTRTKTPTRTKTRTKTLTPTKTKTRTRTPTKTMTRTATVATSTFTPTITQTFTPLPTSVTGYAVHLQSSGSFPKDAVIFPVNTTREDRFLNSTTSFTVEFWFRLMTSPAEAEGRILIDHHAGSIDGPGFWIQLGNNSSGLPVVGGINLNSSDPSAPAFYTATSTTRINDGNWHHIALVRSHDVPGHTLCIWLDGNGDGVANCAIQASVDHDLRVGDWPFYTLGSATDDYSATYHANGYFDELRISDIARYTTASHPKPTARFVLDNNTVMLFHFDEGSGSVVNGTSRDGSGVDTPITGNIVKEFSNYGQDQIPFNTGNSTEAQYLSSMWVNGRFAIPAP